MAILLTIDDISLFWKVQNFPLNNLYLILHDVSNDDRGDKVIWLDLCVKRNRKSVYHFRPLFELTNKTLQIKRKDKIIRILDILDPNEYEIRINFPYNDFNSTLLKFISNTFQLPETLHYWQLFLQTNETFSTKLKYWIILLF